MGTGTERGKGLIQQPGKHRTSVRFGSGSAWVCAERGERPRAVCCSLPAQQLLRGEGGSEHHEHSALGLKRLLGFGIGPRRSRMCWPSPQSSALLGHLNPLEVPSSREGGAEPGQHHGVGTDPTTSPWISASSSPQFRSPLSYSEELRGTTTQVLEQQSPSSTYKAPEALRALEDTPTFPKDLGNHLGGLAALTGWGRPL